MFAPVSSHLPFTRLFGGILYITVLAPGLLLPLSLKSVFFSQRSLNSLVYQLLLVFIFRYWWGILRREAGEERWTASSPLWVLKALLISTPQS